MRLIQIDTINSIYVLRVDDFGMSLMGDNLMNLVGMSEVCVTTIHKCTIGSSLKVSIRDDQGNPDMLTTSTVRDMKTLL
jgi:hypothetical protein